MTIFGPDISSYEHGLNIGALPDPFIIAKVTEGTYYRDADWPTFRDAARAAGKLLAGYHFVTGEDPAAQAANLARWIGDKSIPVMLDFEPAGSSHPTHAQQLAVADAVTAAGMRVRLSYTPRWYWQQLGSPDLTGLTVRGIGVVSSNYPNPSIPNPAQDYAADGGDTGPGWASYGGITPLLWQFTDAGVEQQKMDFNAYRGTVAQLAAFLGSTTPTGDDMPLTQQDADLVAAAVYRHGEEAVTINGQQLKNVALGNLAHGAWVAVNDPHGPVLSKLDQLLARPVVQPVDLAALEAFIVQHQAAGTSAKELAAALVDELQITVSAK